MKSRNHTVYWSASFEARCALLDEGRRCGLVVVSLEGADHVDRLGVQHVGQGVAAQPLFYFIDTRQYLSCSYHLAACTRFIVNSSLSLSINLCTATNWKILQFVLPS